MQIQITDLDRESVSICFITNLNPQMRSAVDAGEDEDCPEPNFGDRHRIGLLNSVRDRPRLMELLADHPNELQQVLGIWGDAPTIEDIGNDLEESEEASSQDEIYSIFASRGSLGNLMAYMSNIQLDLEEPLQECQYLCTSYPVPALLKMIQDLQVRVDQLESTRR